MATWRQIGGGGSIIKWEGPGQTVQGVWRGLRDGKFGALGIVEQLDGSRVSFSMGLILTERLATVEEGEEVKIVFLGRSKNAAPGKKPANLFDVFVLDGDGEEGP
jgi:hypothetical protein